MPAPKILILDLEISPTVAPVWGLFNVNIAASNIIGNSEILSWAAKWHGSDECEYSSLRMVNHTPAGKRRMLKELYRLIDEADIVVGYNSNSFDLKIANKEFLLQGWTKPSPYKTVDLLRVVRSQFRFTSNKLDFVAQQLGLGKKLEHAGMSMWLTCMNPNIKTTEEYNEAWDIMEHYNVEDVFLTEAVYDAVRGWIPNHPNMSFYMDAFVCPNCGSDKVQKRGTARTKALLYQRYHCQTCGAWPRAVKSIPQENRPIQLVIST